MKKAHRMDRLGAMFSAPQMREFISPLRRGEMDRETDPDSPLRRFDSNNRQSESGRKPQFKFQFGDKFTKRPLQYGKYLVLLGRLHIHVMDLETLETRVLISVGEDQAEKVGDMLHGNPQLLEQALKASQAAEEEDGV